MQIKITGQRIPEAEYRMSYQGGEEAELQFGPTYKMTFRVVGTEQSGADITRIMNCPEKPSPKCKLVEFFSKLAGVRPEEGTNIDDDLYVGCEYLCRVVDHGDAYSKVDCIIRRLDDGEKTSDEQAEELF